MSGWMPKLNNNQLGDGSLSATLLRLQVLPAAGPRLVPQSDFGNPWFWVEFNSTVAVVIQELIEGRL
jgi:hypothetical protein